MANVIECDGCGTRISSSMRRGDQLPGVRPLGLSGQLSGCDFHWCDLCADVACTAVLGQRMKKIEAEVCDG